MNILLTGSQGQVGQAVVACARQYAVNIIPLSRAECDVTNEQSVFGAFSLHKPDLVINAAAYTAVDAAEEEPELAQAVNANGSLHLAKACQYYGVPLLHISTDYVFDGGGHSPYTEKDAPNPMSVYGKTKYEGEVFIRSILPQHIILRTSWVFSTHGHNFVKTMLRLFDERETLSVVNDQFGAPTSANSIASSLCVIAKAVVEPSFSDWGVYHFSGAPVATWWEFANRIASMYHSEKKKIQYIHAIPSDQFPMKAKRPRYSVLDTRKIQEVFGIFPCDWRFELANLIKN